MTRLQRTLLTAAIVLAAGGGAAAWLYHRDYKQRGAARQAELNAGRPFLWGRAHVRSFSLKGPKATLAGRCTEKGGCRLTSPIQGPADQEATSALLDNVGLLTIEDEIARGDDAQRKLADYGLGPAPIVFTATTATTAFDAPGARVAGVHRLYVGEKNPVDGRRLVAGGDPLRLGWANDAFYWALDRDLFGFRAKQIFAVRRDDIAKVTIEKLAVPPRTLTVERGAPLWTATTGARAFPADPFIIDKFLILLTRDLKADAFVTDSLRPEQLAQWGLDRPLFRVSVETKSGQVERADVGVAPRITGTGTPEEDGKPAPYVHVEGSSSVSVAYAAFLTDLDKTSDDFRDRRVLDYDPEAVRKIEVRHAGKPPIVLVGQAQSWRIAQPIEAPAKTDRMSALVLRFSKLRATRVVEDTKTPARLAELKLDPADLQVILRGEGDQILGDLRVGKPVDRQLLHVTAAGVARIDAVADAELRLIPLSAEDIRAKP